MTEATLVNVNSDAAHATLTLYDPNGVVLATTTTSIPARGLVRETLNGFFGNGDYTGASHLAVQSDHSLIGHEVVVNGIR